MRLKIRGVLLACVSKNDEATVRELWTYEDHYPRERLLTPDDFVTWRVNWTDKVENIASIAEELGFAPDAFLFIDDNPVEREERLRQRLPDVEVWGEELFSLRRLSRSPTRGCSRPPGDGNAARNAHRHDPGPYSPVRKRRKASADREKLPWPCSMSRR